jgi:hypothetical protein
MAGDAGAFLIGVVWLAALMTLVRPGSQGPTAITNVSNGLIGLVNAGTGGGSFNTTA